MTERDYAVLLVDPDLRTRGMLAAQLAQTGCKVLQAADGETALRIVNDRDVRLVVTELYLRAGDDACLIHAIRRSKTLRNTRTMAHTKHATAADRDWAMRAGADAYLIKPTRAERLRYVVARLSTARGANANVAMTTTSPISRHDTLDSALNDVERGGLSGTSAIVFGRAWWDQLSVPQQTGYRKRAKKVGVTLRSDSAIGEHFVEVRGSPSGTSLSTERSESPYRT